LQKRKLLAAHCASAITVTPRRASHLYVLRRQNGMVRAAGAEGPRFIWTVCYFAAQEFLKDVPFTLALIEFDGADTLFLSRLSAVERADIRIGMKGEAEVSPQGDVVSADVIFISAS